MCSYKSLLPQPCSWYSKTEIRTRQECAATSPYCLSPAVSSHRQKEELDRNVQLQVLIATVQQSVLKERVELDRNVQLQVLIASVLQSVLRDREQNQIGTCSYKSLLLQSYSRFSEMQRRTRYEFAATSTYCLSPDIGTHRHREELDRNVQLQVLIDSALQSVLRDRQIRTRQECAATSPYCFSPTVSTQRQGEELDRNLQLQVLIASVLKSVLTDTEELDRNVQLQVLIDSELVLRDRQKNRQECAATSPYCLSPAVGTQRRREELDRNVQLQVLIASVLQSVLTDTEKNQIGMCSYKSLLTQPCTQYSEKGIRTRQECAATSPYCLSPEVSTHRRREELDRNVQLQVLIASVLTSVLTETEKNQIGMFSYKSLLPQPCSWYSQTERRTRQECAATSPYCLSPAVGSQRRREELDRNVQLQVLIASVLTSVLTDREKNQIGMFSYKSLLPQPCSQYSETGIRTRQECAATSPYCLSPVVSTQRQGVELDRNVQLQVLIASVQQSVLIDKKRNQIGMFSYKSLLPQSSSQYSKRELELDRNVQLQVLIASVLQSVLRDREQNQIGMCSYKSLLPQSCTVGSQRWREELDRNVQLQVLIASVLTSVLTDTEKNQIGMFSYKSLLTQPCTQYSETGIRTRQECAATSPYCLSPVVSTQRQGVELDRNVQLQVLIASVLKSALIDGQKNQIGMCSYKSLLPQF